MYARERREATIPRTRNARTRAYISTVSHSLSSGKFIRANIRDAVKVTLFNVHPLRETSVHTPCAARRRPTRPLSTSFQTTTRFFNSKRNDHVRPLFLLFFSLPFLDLHQFAPSNQRSSPRPRFPRGIEERKLESREIERNCVERSDGRRRERREDRVESWSE